MMPELPDHVEKYAETPVFTQETVPEKLTNLHDTKAGVWGRIVVDDGELDYIIPGETEFVARIKPGVFGIIRPTERHRVAMIGDVQFKVEFLR